MLSCCPALERSGASIVATNARGSAPWALALALECSPLGACILHSNPTAVGIRDTDRRTNDVADCKCVVP